jgi:molybdate transport system regulatory protein
MASKLSRPRTHDQGPGLREGDAGGGPRLNGRVWIEAGGETFLAWGRAVLLDRIRETGSLSAAARSMGMGYRHAWDLVQQMNRLAPRALVEKAPGGRGGGGSKLTPDGEAAVARFWALAEAFRSWLAARDPEPRPTRKGRRP